MRLNNYIYFTRKRMRLNRFRFFMSILVSVLAFFLLLFSVTIPQILSHGRREITKCLKKNSSEYGIMCNGFDTYENENLSSYLQELYNTDEIESVGMWQYTGLGHIMTKDSEIDYFNTILDAYGKHRKAFSDSENEIVQSVVMSREALEINQLSFYKKEQITEEIDTSGQVLIYLGYHFREVPVGTVFYRGTGQNHLEYRVAGILEKNTCILDWQSILLGTNSIQLSYSIPLDNMILMSVRPGDMGYLYLENFFSVSNGYTYEEATSKIKEISDKYSITVETETFSHRVDEVMEMNDWLMNGIGKIAFLLFFSSFVILLSTQLLTLFQKKEDFGILVSCGLNKKQVAKLLFFENLIKLVIADVIAYILLLLFLKYQSFDSSVYYELRFILFGNIFVEGIILAVLMSVIASLLPILCVYRQPIQNLVKGEWQKRKSTFFREQPFVCFLFLLSFFVTFLTMFFALDLFRQNKDFGKEREKCDYKEKYRYAEVIENKQRLSDLPAFDVQYGNVYLKCSLPVGDGIVQRDVVNFLLRQNETLLETVHYEKGCSLDMPTTEPICIIGDMYLKEAIFENGKKYINIFGKKCRVIGEFAPISYAGLDSRCIAVASTFQKKDFTEMITYPAQTTFIYKRKSNQMDSEKEKFRDFAFQILDKENLSDIDDQGYFVEDLDSGIFENFSGILSKVVVILLFVCFGNCAFLASVYGEIHLYEMMLKRTMGYSGRKTLMDLVKKLLLFELCAFFIAALTTLFYGCLNQKTYFWLRNILEGLPIVFLTFFIFSFGLSIIPFMLVQKRKPVEILRCKE